MWGPGRLGGYHSRAMGQPVSVIEKPSTQGGVVRFEINRVLTGMATSATWRGRRSRVTARRTSWPAGCSSVVVSTACTSTRT